MSTMKERMMQAGRSEMLPGMCIDAAVQSAVNAALTELLTPTDEMIEAMVEAVEIKFQYEFGNNPSFSAGNFDLNYAEMFTAAIQKALES